MNPNIPRLIRACYASNKTKEWDTFTRNHIGRSAENALGREQYVSEMNYALWEEVDNKRKALHGDYVGRIFDDMSVKTGVAITEANLRKRLMGIYGELETYMPKKIYREAIARYVGCASWLELERDVDAMCEAMEDSVRNVYSMDFRFIDCKDIIKIDSLYDGDIITFRLSEGASLVLAYIGEEKFLVKYAEGLILQQNDILRIQTPFVIKNRIYAPEVYRAKEMEGEWLCRHTIISFSITKGATRQKHEMAERMKFLSQVEENRKRRETNEEERRKKQMDKIKAKNAKCQSSFSEQNAQERTVEPLEKPGESRTFAQKSDKSMNKEIKKSKKLCVMGSGSMCFDTIIQREYPQGFVKGKKNKFEDRIVMEEIGSNPGNVMCILGYFGWDSYPIAMFDNYPQGLQMKKDFERYHCNTRFVTNTDEGGTNCFSIIHCLDDKTGEPTMKHSKKHAPFSGFPRDKGLTVQGKDATLPKFIEKLDFLPDVYFYSGNNPGWRDLGKYMRSKGVLVYYEIQSMSENEFSKYFACMKEADIVKFSDETIPNIDSLHTKEGKSLMDELKDKLVIQTLGAKGARFNLFGKGWVTLPPIVNDNVVDTEGCGDWTTASFINAIGKRGVLKLSDMTETLVKECLEEAQVYASRNVSYMGTKGIIAADKSFNLAPSDYVDTIMAEMDGHIGVKKEKINNLKDIPAKDLMVYDAKNCLIYRSDYECLNGVERVFDKKKDGVSVMSNFYPCNMPYVYNDKELVFNSAEQAYHFFRYREFPLVQWMIMQQKAANDVKSACGGFKYVDSDHEKTRWMYMTLIEELKYLYCKEFRKKLNDLGDIMLVESSGSDDIFGSAIPGDAKKAVAYAQKHDIDLIGKYIGMNGCGRCIMAVREKFRGWTEQQLKEYTPNPDINIWWESSPAYRELIEGMGKD